MGFENIIFEQRDGVARLRLNRPDRLNAFTIPMHAEVAAVLDLLEADEEWRVLLLTGEGRGFSAGLDLNESMPVPGQPPRDLAVPLERRWGPLVRRLSRLRAPVVCAVNGVAAGAGANVALACDVVIAAKSARFIQSFVQIGLVPDAGGTWILPRLVGQARAMGLALTAEPLPAETAAEWGLIWRAVEDERFAEEVEALVARLASLPPLALAAVKRAMRASSVATLEQQLDLERDLQRQLGFSADHLEGITAFNERRPPAFTGH
ncbi:2-(1,2-epoxy-1,2-dihydrophenyl)acetyl-CoA isomerase PaaG [Sphingomonas sp. MG17]|jgi:2-(1,2-epoxy-1,2-dihydrophenyl)acetyl-CoA isomerase|uniref:2-(1,2-epoxy-1,2-dihydrophenyl)acetyl-CoA isomerase PaaG n=1 Tax=Sphingomonas tagetis TaxID=2949092 RepID=A0A9X2HVK8_9SPHN|nr:2-(1,2-epoxy-1,2-dihydrophenyl)acetyl-CoA isomerase PaaG [Sphingomonas tagetis]MCP3732810.1 2-(1,2-epoxy-1,2-dihydrophenyl)acetyl-CoA isomerase PaaG [Sphingomonas tagetis]